MTIMQKIEELNNERGWSLYELSKRTDISESTIYTWKRKNKCPSIPVLSKICAVYGITVYQFFNGIGDESFTDEQKYVLNTWSVLSTQQKENVLQTMKLFAQINSSSNS